MRARSTAVLGGVSALGIIVAHLLAYALVEPDPHARSSLLASTGHQWWSVTAAAALGLGAASLARWLMSSRSGSSPIDLRRSGLALIAFQVTGFLLLEGLERITSGGNPGAMFSEPVIIGGLLLQILIAVLLSGLLGVLAAGVRFLTARSSGPARGRVTPTFPLPAERRMRRLLLATGGLGTRGPPETS